MSMNINDEEGYKNPQYYEHKANQLRMENQFLKRQLEANLAKGQVGPAGMGEKVYVGTKNDVEYTFQDNIPVRQVIYKPVSQPIKPPYYTQPRKSSFQALPQRVRTQQYFAPQRQQPYRPYQPVYYNQPYSKQFINQTEQEIIQLQSRSCKLERQANRLSSYIKEDLRGFIKDSHINKQCSYKQKYLRAISSRPRYFRFDA